MIINNKNNAHNTGSLELLQSYMLIGNRNVKDAKISVQISYIPIDSEQPLHSHEPEQCYYIIKGKGLMIIEEEQEHVQAGDAIYIPPNKKHGIKNIGQEKLEYLTVNTPPFDYEYEKKLWPSK